MAVLAVRIQNIVGERKIEHHLLCDFTLVAATAPLLPDEGWGDSNYLSADDPGNRVGDPPGGAMDEGAGSGNFQIAAPVLGLPSRGIDISLGLAYNSRLWNKAGSQIGFDNDRGWPAPGWSLGFSKLLGMGVYHGGMIVEADGKALHITELRNAINDLRIRPGFATYSWQTSATSGGLIKADPILEMRTALDQAIEPPPSPGYAAGLGPSQPILAIHIQELRNRVVSAWNTSSEIPRRSRQSLL